MTFGPFDALAVFAAAAIFVGVASYLLMRAKLDWGTWAVLSVTSLPPAVYFTIRNGGGVEAIAVCVAGLWVGWAILLGLVWIRWRTDDWLLTFHPIPAPPESAEAVPVVEPSPKRQMRRGLAYLLLGFGIPTAGAGAFVFRMLFIPNRHWPALLRFSAESPAVWICAIALAIGLTLFGAGWWLLRHPAPGEPPPR